MVEYNDGNYELYAIHKYRKHIIYRVTLVKNKIKFNLIPYYDEWKDKDLVEEYDLKSFMKKLQSYEWMEAPYGFILRRKLFNSQATTGWISPSGEFFSCDTFEHEPFARLYLEKTSQELENEGWIKIERNDEHSKYIETFYENPQVITNAQENTLIKLGFQDKDYKDWMVI